MAAMAAAKARQKPGSESHPDLAGGWQGSRSPGHQLLLFISRGWTASGAVGLALMAYQGHTGITRYTTM